MIASYLLYTQLHILVSTMYFCVYVGVRDRQHKPSGNSRSKGGGTGIVMHYLIELHIILTQKLEST